MELASWPRVVDGHREKQLVPPWRKDRAADWGHSHWTARQIATRDIGSVLSPGAYLLLNQEFMPTKVLASRVLSLLRGRGSGGPGLLLFNPAEFEGGYCSRPSSLALVPGPQ